MALIETAYTREEIAAAREALEHHLQMFPESRKTNMGHVLPFLEENANQRDEDARRLELSPTEIKERDALLKSAASFRDPLAQDAVAELRILEATLRGWVQEHETDAAVRQTLQNIQNELEMMVSLHQSISFEPKEAFAVRQSGNVGRGRVKKRTDAGTLSR